MPATSTVFLAASVKLSEEFVQVLAPASQLTMATYLPTRLDIVPELPVPLVQENLTLLGVGDIPEHAEVFLEEVGRIQRFIHLHQQHQAFKPVFAEVLQPP